MSEIIKLKHPFTWKNQLIDQLEVRKPKPRHLEAMDEFKGDIARNNALFAALCNVPIDVVRELDFEDFQALAEVIAASMGKSLGTGENL